MIGMKSMNNYYYEINLIAENPSARKTLEIIFATHFSQMAKIHYAQRTEYISYIRLNNTVTKSMSLSVF